MAKLDRLKGSEGASNMMGKPTGTELLKQLKSKNGNGREGHDGVLLGGEEWRKGAGRIKNG